MANTSTSPTTGRPKSLWTFDQNGDGGPEPHGGGDAILGVAVGGDIDGGNLRWQVRPEGTDEWFNVGTLVTDVLAPIQHIQPLPRGDVRAVLTGSAGSTTSLVCIRI